jgi:hypothetical protein
MVYDSDFPDSALEYISLQSMRLFFTLHLLLTIPENSISNLKLVPMTSPCEPERARGVIDATIAGKRLLGTVLRLIIE